MKINNHNSSSSLYEVKRVTLRRALRFGLLLGVCSSFVATGFGQYDAEWRGGTGSWSDVTKWNTYTDPDRVPPVHFVPKTINGGTPDEEVIDAPRGVDHVYFGGTGNVVNIDDGDQVAASSIWFVNGANVTFNLGEASHLAVLTGTAPFSTTSPAGNMNIGVWGANPTTVAFFGAGSGVVPRLEFGNVDLQNGATLSFENGLNVEANEVFIGQAGTQSKIQLINNVQMTAKITRVYNQGELFISGAETSYAANGIAIGTFGHGASLSGEAAYNYAPVRNNKLHIADGGFAEVRNSNSVSVGGAVYARSNEVLVEGEGSTLKIHDIDQSKVSLLIGNEAGNGLGGNSVTVKDGGTILHNRGLLHIAGYNENGGFNDGANRLIVGAGGTYTGFNGTINNGLIQVATSGTFTTSSMSVNDKGRLEVSGDGFSTTTSGSGVAVHAGGAFAVGLTPTGAEELEASIATVSSKFTFDTGSTIEFDLFGNESSDQIEFATGSIFSIADGVTIKLSLDGAHLAEVSAGDKWTLLTGLTGSALDATSVVNLANANFDATALGGGLSWDYSNFNAEGGWEVSVAIPEPSSIVLGVLGGFAGLMLRKRRKQ